MYLVCDVSGSMLENGKFMIMRGVARSVEQYYRLGYGKEEITLVEWGKEARIVEWVLDNEFPPEMLACAGFADAKSLTELLGEQPAGNVLLVTDGFYTNDALKVLKRWINKLQPGILRIIKIGADAASTELKGANEYMPEDLFAALSDWQEGSAA